MPSQNFVNIFDAKTLSTLKLINDNVLVETFDNRAKTNDGIIVPIVDANVFIPTVGKVIAVADSVKEIKVGDQVCFEKYKGERGISEDGSRTFLLLKSSMILGIISDDIDVSKI